MMAKLGCFLFFLMNIIRTVLSVQIRATAPMSLVSEGGVLSLHCKISDLDTNQRVILSRNTGIGSDDLTWNDRVIVNKPDIEERLYLATRQLGDGSLVYFLSVTDVWRKDEGTYSCKVLDSSSYAVIIQKEVTVSVKYFPALDPLCSLQALHSGYSFVEGAKIVLNCTSEQSRPPATLKWSRSGSSPNEIFNSAIVVEGAKITSAALYRTLTLRDNNKVFSCRMSSRHFPGKELKCHIGPIRVTKSNPNIAGLVDNDYEMYSTHTLPVDENTVQSSDCRTRCSLSKESEYYWILASVVAGIFALTFCIIVIVLACKYYRLMTIRTEIDISSRPAPLDDLYEKVQCSEDVGREYMPLKKTLYLDNRLLFVQKNDMSHYNTKPSHQALTYPAQCP